MTIPSGEPGPPSLTHLEEKLRRDKSGEIFAELSRQLEAELLQYKSKLRRQWSPADFEKLNRSSEAVQAAIDVVDILLNRYHS